MDPDLPPRSPAARKVKFAPKGPPRRRPPQSVPPKIESAAKDGDSSSDDNETAQSLLRRAKEHLARRGPKAEKKSSVQVTFSHEVASPTLRTFSKPRETTDEDKGNAVRSRDTASDDHRQDRPETGRTERLPGESSAHATNLTEKKKKKKKEFREPWDYSHSYYPITLPLRRPYSGNPELLDEEEFGKDEEVFGNNKGKAAAKFMYDENTINAASDLGLLEENDQPQLLFLQLPHLPLPKRQVGTNKKEIAGISSQDPVASTSAKGKEMVGSSVYQARANASKKGCSLEELPEGSMGKILVYKSGKVKLKLGEVLYDVSPGSECIFAQQVMAINTTEKHCCELGELNKHVVIAPDIDSLLNR